MLKESDTLFDLLITRTVYPDSDIFVVRNDGQFLFSVTNAAFESPLKEHNPQAPLGELDDHLNGREKEQIGSDTPTTELLAWFQSSSPEFYPYSWRYEACDNPIGVQNRNLASQGVYCGVDAYSRDEIPIVDVDGKLLCVVEKSRFFSAVSNYKVADDAPTHSFVPGYRVTANRAGLNHYAKNICSQNGEDGIVLELLNRIGTKSRYCVEFGAGNGIAGSNSRELIANHGFSALLIEGDAHRFAGCAELYSDNERVTCMQAYVGFLDQTNGLDSMLSAHNSPENPDVMSIDIDGYDYHVWAALKNHRPRVVIIEYNFTADNETIFITPRSENVRQMSSAAALVSLGIQKGYELAAVTYTNLLFVAREEFPKLGIADNRLSVLRPSNSFLKNTWLLSHDDKIYHMGVSRHQFNAGRQFNSDVFAVV